MELTSCRGKISEKKIVGSENSETHLLQTGDTAIQKKKPSLKFFLGAFRKREKKKKKKKRAARRA